MLGLRRLRQCHVCLVHVWAAGQASLNSFQQPRDRDARSCPMILIGSFERHVRTRRRGKATLNSPLIFLEYQNNAAGQFQQDRSLY